jgi:hypothetical protein
MWFSLLIGFEVAPTLPARLLFPSSSLDCSYNVHVATELAS